MVKWTVKTKCFCRSRQRADAGIALGPILFVLAILVLLGTLFSAGSGTFGEASIIDRVAADTPSQANLILNMIGQCHQQYLTDQSLLEPFAPTPTPAPEPYPDTYPSTIGSTILVKNLLCNANGGSTTPPSLWSTGNVMPTPTKGFGDWNYIDDSGNNGGRCIWIQPTTPTGPISSALSRAAAKFTHNTSNDGSSTVNFDPTKSGLRFVVWVTLPTGTANANCKPQ